MKKNIIFLLLFVISFISNGQVIDSGFCNRNKPDAAAIKPEKLSRIRHPNWVEILNIKDKILAKKKHVLTIEVNTSNTGFTGCHSKMALEKYIADNPTTTYELKNKIMDASNNGVYIAEPVIKLANGKELKKVNNRGQSTFFPDSWDEARVLDEVEYAIANNYGKFPGGVGGSEYFGYSRDYRVEIHFYLNRYNGSIGSYFPVKK